MPFHVSTGTKPRVKAAYKRRLPSSKRPLAVRCSSAFTQYRQNVPGQPAPPSLHWGDGSVHRRQRAERWRHQLTSHHLLPLRAHRVPSQNKGCGSGKRGEHSTLPPTWAPSTRHLHTCITTKGLCGLLLRVGAKPGPTHVPSAVLCTRAEVMLSTWPSFFIRNGLISITKPDYKPSASQCSPSFRCKTKRLATAIQKM